MSWLEYVFAQQPDMAVRLKAVYEHVAAQKRGHKIAKAKVRG
jgi:hypothetical protein